ncbi:uncharacterized protein LOC116290509, partial [Actinia tenebrosa]|uniref:Uncharacterized protein LOC116290509 n=1 Tax=Actinia tenebrosa TaxID=6105 RepID=A0A6P8HCP6_ACTTE
MVPFGESTTMSLLQVQGVAVRNRSFSLTLLPALRHLSAVCVSSPMYRTPTISPVSRNIQSSERRTSSVSSLSKETMVYEEQEFWQRQSKQKHWQNESKHDSVLTSDSQQIYEKFSLKMTTTPEKKPESSLETKTEQSLEFSSSHSSNGDVQASSSSESKNLSKTVKNKISLSKASKSTNKSRKLSRKSCKRRNSAKSSRKVPSVFERLTNSTFKSDYHSDRGWYLICLYVSLCVYHNLCYIPQFVSKLAAVVATFSLLVKFQLNLWLF